MWYLGGSRFLGCFEEGRGVAGVALRVFVLVAIAIERFVSKFSEQ